MFPFISQNIQDQKKLNAILIIQSHLRQLNISLDWTSYNQIAKLAL